MLLFYRTMLDSGTAIKRWALNNDVNEKNKKYDRASSLQHGRSPGKRDGSLSLSAKWRSALNTAHRRSTNTSRTRKTSCSNCCARASASCPLLLEQRGNRQKTKSSACSTWCKPTGTLP